MRRSWRQAQPAITAILHSSCVAMHHTELICAPEIYFGSANSDSSNDMI
jgi:hypothetical protein